MKFGIKDAGKANWTPLKSFHFYVSKFFLMNLRALTSSFLLALSLVEIVSKGKRIVSPIQLQHALTNAIFADLENCNLIFSCQTFFIQKTFLNYN